MTIAIRRYHFHCRWTSEARLPVYPGSTLRGAFGWALKKISCMSRREDCADCPLGDHCPYAWLFATKIAGEKTQSAVRPHPLLIQPGGETAGGAWNFSLLLIGGGDWAPFLIHSVNMMGESGIGAAAKRGAGRFVVEEVQRDGLLIYDGQTRRIADDAPPRLLSLTQTAGDPVMAVRLRLLTPLRLKQDNSLSAELPFSTLIRATLRRLSALENVYGRDEHQGEHQGEPQLDYRGLIHRAEAVTMTASSLRWRQLQRYSNRQKQHVSLSGLMGEAAYAGALDEFMPLLNYAAAVNLGKQTLFGLGRIEVEAIGRTAPIPA